MNVDSLRNRETRETLTKRMTKMKIDIAMIQETHWVNNGEWGSRIYFLCNIGKGKWKGMK